MHTYIHTYIHTCAHKVHTYSRYIQHACIIVRVSFNCHKINSILITYIIHHTYIHAYIHTYMQYAYFVLEVSSSFQGLEQALVDFVDDCIGDLTSHGSVFLLFSETKMYVYICMYSTYVYACMYVCMYCMYVYMYVCMYV